MAHDAASVDARRARARALTTVAAVAGAAVTIFVAASPTVRFAYDARSLHVFLETTGGLIALLVAYLVLGRFWAGHRQNDLLLSCGLATVAASSLLLYALPSALDRDLTRFMTWAALGGRLLGAVLVAIAAFSSARRSRRPSRSALIAFASASVALAAIAAAAAFLAGRLPPGVDPEMSPAEALARPQMPGHPLLLGGQLITALVYAAAAVGFARRAARTDDELLHWFAAGSIVASAAAMHYFLFPSLYTRWVYTGDVIRLVAQMLLLAGAAREIGRYWRRLAATAVLEERRRIARDLHDGVAQELSFIARAVADREVAAAAERAIVDTRAAIVSLTRPVDEPLDVALEAAVETVADRAGQPVVLDLAPNVRVDPRAREALVRIACEAVSNAGHHGRARTVRVELAHDRGVRLRVADDGIGFEPDRIDRGTHFGITSMRERARAVDAELRLASAPGRGTEIEVRLP